MNYKKQFTDYVKGLGGIYPQNHWNDLEFEFETIYGTLRVSVWDSDFTKIGALRKKKGNLVSIFTSFKDFDKALPYLEKTKPLWEGMPVLNSKKNYHLSGGNSINENFVSNFERFKNDLEKIIIKNENN